jgi:hypothetical protein
MSQKFGRFTDPRDPRRPERISLAYGEWKDIPSRIIDKYGDSVTELDLSHNKFLYPLTFDLSLHSFAFTSFSMITQELIDFVCVLLIVLIAFTGTKIIFG